MLKYHAETCVNRRMKMRKETLLLSAMLIALCSVGVNAQANGTIKRVSEDSRSKIIEQMSAEAKKFNLELNRNSLAFHNTDNTLTVGMQVTGMENARESDLLKGADIAFVYVDSDKRSSVPNGFYKVRISEIKGGRPQPVNSLKGRNLIASFINVEGQVIKQFPVGIGDSSSGGAPQGIYVQQGLWGGRWYAVSYFASNYDMWAWMAGPYGP
jgi:Cu/Ag efflux protein CusF